MSGIKLELDGLEQAVTRIVEEKLHEHDSGFLDARGAAEYLSTTRKAIYALVERHGLPCHRAGGRLLFDKRKVREWVERGA